MSAVLGVGVLMFALIGAAVLLGLALFAFWIWMLVDCATRETDEGNTKLVWLLVVIFVGWLGALIYFLARRPERIRACGR